MRWLVIGLMLVVLCSALVNARGYTDRACGFDMDDDLIYGEPEDCNVGDGVTLDPDGDGVNEDLLYVDCDTGSDTTGDGSPGNPYASINFALTQADGPSDGAEDIIAFAGTCTQEQHTKLSVSGVAGTKIRPKSGSESRDFEYPRNPVMIIGWDKDNDGEYPPYDSDDTSVLYGGAPGCLAMAFTVDNQVITAFLELAHFTIREYGECSMPNDASSGIMGLRGMSNAFNTHHYYHDIFADGINRGRTHESNRIAFSHFIGHHMIKWFAWENMHFKDTGGYVFRGEAPSGTGFSDSGPLRYQDLSYNCLACDAGNCTSPTTSTPGQCTGWKLWGWFTGVEVIDSYFDYTPEKFGQAVFGHPSNFLGAYGCSQDWVIRNNEIVDFKSVFGLQVYNGRGTWCNQPDQRRTVDDIVIDQNIWRNEYNWQNQASWLLVSSCEFVDATIEDLTITNNIVYSKYGGGNIASFQCGLEDGGPNPGTITIAHNTFYMGSGPGNIFTQIGCLDCANPPCAIPENFVIKNNIIENPGKRAYLLECAPGNFQADYNTYAPTAKFRWNATNRDWAQWKAVTGGEANSDLCSPSFVNSLGGDVHLASSDTCAQDAGSAGATIDVDGDSRPQGSGWDIGADEVSSGGSCHWADADCNADISISELVTVVLDWQSGSRSIAELVEVVLLWQA